MWRRLTILRVSRVTLVVNGSDAAIAQLNAQLAKLVDVVNIHDMTLGEHFERELVDREDEAGQPAAWRKAMSLAKKYGAEILDEAQVSCTVQLTGRVARLTSLSREAAKIGRVLRGCAQRQVAVSKGEVTLSSFDDNITLGWIMSGFGFSNWSTGR